MRIAIIDNVCGPGMWKYDISLAKGLIAEGHHVSLLTSKDFPVEATAGTSIALHLPFPSLRIAAGLAMKGVSYLDGIARCAAILFRERFDVVHWQFFRALPPAEALLAGAVRLSRMPLVVTVHDVRPWSANLIRGETFVRMVCRAARTVVVHHEANRKDLASVHGIDPDKIRVIRHGSFLDFSPPRDATGAAPSGAAAGSPPTVLFFGQIKPEKGLDVLIQAMAQVREMVPGARLVVAGRPWKSDTRLYSNLISSFDLDRTVICRFEHVPDDEVDALFAAADVVALPYLQVTQSGVLLQAMSSGRPVVVSDVGALGETVREAGCGLVVAPGAPAALADAIASILSVPGRAARFSANAVAAARTRHDWRSCAVATLAVYRALVTESARPLPAAGAEEG